MPLVAVAVPVPYLEPLTYRVPEGLPVPPAGARVRVPLGSRQVTGVVLGVGSPMTPGSEPKALLEVFDTEPYLPAPVVELCRWVADYYMAGIGDTIGVALPPGARDRQTSIRTRRIITATAHGRGLVEEAAAPAGRRALGGRQREALEALALAPLGLTAAQLRERGVSSDTVTRLITQGLATARSEQDARDPFSRSVMAVPTHDQARPLTGEQAAALARLEALADTQAFRVAVVHGVTGSGKTELYVRLARHVCAAGRRALILVPEIALTPSVAAQFRAAFGDRVAIQHSGLSDGERHDQWQRIRAGEVDAVVGTRSAVFAPLSDLGVVIVDEEHDGSYKQEDAPRYHGRDVAVMRGSQEGALVVLGSATPSMESYQNAAAGKYERIVLERRILDRPMAAVRVVNMREEYAAQGPDTIISRDLATAIGERLERREQVVVLLNRRGYATSVFCRQCGESLECPNCSVSLTVHSAGRGWRGRCHYCNYSVSVPKQCGKCAAPYMEQAGFGTEKVEEQIRTLFPGARVGRVDRDTVRRQGALTALLSTFAAGELDILVGTQMIAKGHDFPRVTLVGVISADVGLGMADFRAAERTFQLLTQVAGRAGRGEQRGEAIIQTINPEHYSIQLACRQEFDAFFEREIGFRRAMEYPPLFAMVNVVVRGKTFEEAMLTAQALVTHVEAGRMAGGYKVLGPAPAPLTRLRGEHRAQFFVKGSRRAAMRDALRAALAAMPEVRKRVSVDVDPLTVL